MTVSMCFKLKVFSGYVIHLVNTVLGPKYGMFAVSDRRRKLRASTSVRLATLDQ
jgi:hypothetical protein